MPRATRGACSHLIDLFTIDTSKLAVSQLQRHHFRIFVPRHALLPTGALWLIILCFRAAQQPVFRGSKASTAFHKRILLGMRVVLLLLVSEKR